MKLWGLVLRINDSSLNRTNDISCLLFVFFLLVSQLLFVRMVEKHDNTTSKTQQHQFHDVMDY